MKRKKRSDWDRYFMEIAGVVASRSTCDRNHVGAVIVRDHIILSTGYNGSIRKMPHCDDTGHKIENGHCINTVHAEANAIIQAAYTGVSIKDADIYVTSFPCWPCFKMIANAGLRRIFFSAHYGAGAAKVRNTAKKIGIRLIRI